MSLIIKKVEAVPGLAPALRFTTTVRLDAGEPATRLFIAKWIGEIGFTSHAEANAPNLLGANRLVLPAIWTSEPDGSRQLTSQEVSATFTCGMTPSILDEIERFRDGGRLFARVQGKFQAFLLGRTDARRDAAIDELLRCLIDRPYVLWHDAFGDSLELTRDTWCTEILPILRPPGRLVLEARLPLCEAAEEHGRRALGHLERAQRAFDEGRYEETARLVYQCGEALQQLGDAVQTRYGDLARSSIAKQNSSVQALCHPERHDESKVVGGHDTDRTMALHLLVSMKSLAAVYLAGPPGSGT